METREIHIWTPHAGQKRILDDNARFKVISSARRFGKTTYAINYLLEEALMTNGGLFYYIAPYFRQAKQIAWTMLLDSVLKLPKELVIKVNESELSVIVGNNTKIYLKGADNPDSLRGVGLNGVVMDEVADMRPNVFPEIIRPALTDTKGWCIFIGTPKGFNSFYSLYQQAATLPGWSRFKFKTIDNPFIDPKEIEDARASMTDDLFAQEYEAEFRRFEGLVYKEFNHEQHVVDKVPEHFEQVICGVDFGFQHPTAMTVWGLDKDGVYWLIDEYYQSKKTIDEIVEAGKNIQAKFNVNMFYPDPEAPEKIEDMRRAGLYCREVNKSVIPGIDRVRSLMKQNRIKIKNTCSNFLFEVDRYVYPPEDVASHRVENPLKENDDILDSCRYALFTHNPADMNQREEKWKTPLYDANYG